METTTGSANQGFWYRLKRAMLISTLYFRLIRNYDPDDTALEEFNRIFHLVSQPQDLSFNVMVCKLMWKESTVSQVVEQCEAERYEEAVAIVCGSVPRWLRYNGHEEMLLDVERVLRESMHHRPSTA